MSLGKEVHLATIEEDRGMWVGDLVEEYVNIWYVYCEDKIGSMDSKLMVNSCIVLFILQDSNPAMWWLFCRIRIRRVQNSG